MDPAKKLAINLVTWNSRAYLGGFLASLTQQDSQNFSLTVIDNASDDGTVSWLQERHPYVAVLRNFRNQGFARAHNQAIELALSRWQGEDLKTRYIMVANPDLEFAPSALRVIIAFMDANPEIAACGPKLLRIFLRPDSHNEEYETTRSNIIDSTGLTINKMRRVYDRGAGEVDEGQYNETEPVFGISGACTIFRASNLLEAKLGNEFYDEDFFAYKEDVDMAWRIQRLGFNTFYVPQAIVWHHRRAPSDPGASWFKAWRDGRKLK